MDKMREEFEKWYSNRPHYGEAHKQELWETWQASRESLVVDLPLSTSDGQRVWLDYEDVELSLNKAGVNYK